ncbi:MAG: MBL fold metallo-hydrolase [Jatrophihabitans sp.]|nr:MAG: MBL fold metallo-hydrolase [Jatrophihabitans sp.]
MSDARAYLERIARTLPAAASGLVRPRRPTGADLADVHLADLPVATAGVRVHALLQNEWDAPTAAVVEGQLTPPTTRMAIGAFLVEHPSGTFLVDAGMCADAHTRHLADLPALVRSLTAGPPPQLGVAAAIAAAGFDPQALQFALLTHVHWDHVSGLARPDQCQVPLVDARRQPGDGSVVLCDLSGHTPGHCGVLLALRSGRRILLAGDAVWNLAQVRLVRQRSALARLADADPDAAYRTVVRLSRLPSDVLVLPAHDHAAITTAFGAGPLA